MPIQADTRSFVKALSKCGSHAAVSFGQVCYGQSFRHWNPFQPCRYKWSAKLTPFGRTCSSRKTIDSTAVVGNPPARFPLRGRAPDKNPGTPVIIQDYHDSMEKARQFLGPPQQDHAVALSV